MSMHSDYDKSIAPSMSGILHSVDPNLTTSGHAPPRMTKPFRK
jgi:hypothetical protein